MATVMKLAAVVSGLLTLLFGVLCPLELSWVLSAAITCGTFCYHFTMRLAVGYILNRTMQNRADLTKRWYQLHPFEQSLYKFLQVKKWKGKMPTYAPSVFDPRQHTWEEIAQAMCQAEIVHEVIAVLSFLPLLAAIPFDSFPVFLITSLMAAGYDLSFVIMQRYNRPRILKLIRKNARI